MQHITFKSVGFPVLPRLSGSTSALVSGIIAFASTVWFAQMLNDGDTYWHIAAGQWMLDHRSVLKTDPFSFTFFDKPWQTHEWLSELLMAVSYRTCGWAGVMLLTASAIGVSVYIIVKTVSRWLTGIALWMTVSMGFSLMGPHFLARPHLLVLPLLSLWSSELIVARSERRAPSFWLLGVIVLWANMHGSFLIGLGLATVFGAEAWLQSPKAERSKIAWTWAGFCMVSCLACLLTPHGLSGLIFPIKLLLMPGVNTILEWSPVNFGTVSPLEVSMFALIFVLATKAVSLSRIRLALLLGLLFITLKHQRHEMILGIVGMLILAEPLGAVFRNERPAISSPDRWRREFAVSCLIISGLVCMRISIPVPSLHNDQTPAQALAAVPAAVRATPVLNDYGLGGYLIWQGIKPFIDGRTDMYGRQFLDHYYVIMRPDPARLFETLQQYGIGWTLLRKDNPAVNAMDNMHGWRRLYSDSQFVVHARN